MANRRPLRGAFIIPPPQGAVTDCHSRRADPSLCAEEGENVARVHGLVSLAKEAFEGCGELLLLKWLRDALVDASAERLEHQRGIQSRRDDDNADIRVLPPEVRQ